MAPLLQIETLRAGYGPIEVLKGVSLEVNEGEIVTMIGANGAGKTTTLMCVSGVNKIRSGRILFGGLCIYPCLSVLILRDLVRKGNTGSPR